MEDCAITFVGIYVFCSFLIIGVLALKKLLTYIVLYSIIIIIMKLFYFWPYSFVIIL